MERCWVAGLLALISCQQKDSPPTVPSAFLDEPAARPVAPVDAAVAAPATEPAAMAVLTVDAACARIKTLIAGGCDWTGRFPPDFTTGTVCEQSLSTWLAPGTPDRASLERSVSCWALDCDEAAACMVSAQALRPPPPPRACGEEGTAAIEVDSATWLARRGAKARRFADVKTTVAEPIEVCGIDGEVEWMTRVTCNDGSTPYGSPSVVNDSRDPWFGRGGRCNSILDRYSARCPEQTYTIHVDRYVCPAS